MNLSIWTSQAAHQHGNRIAVVEGDKPGLVDFVCRLGIDAVMLDCEQGNPGLVDVENMTRAARLHDVSSLVRIPSADPWVIERYVMRGVDGIVIPRLDSSEQA